MTTNSKPELCEVCGGTAEKPRLVQLPDCDPAPTQWDNCTAPIHSQADKPEQANHNTSGNLLPALHPADKHKRVAERLWMEPPIQPNAMGTGKQVLEVFERILREEYPE